MTLCYLCSGLIYIHIYVPDVWCVVIMMGLFLTNIIDCLGCKNHHDFHVYYYLLQYTTLFCLLVMLPKEKGGNNCTELEFKVDV